MTMHVKETYDARYAVCERALKQGRTAEGMTVERAEDVGRVRCKTCLKHLMNDILGMAILLPQREKHLRRSNAVD